MYFYCYVYVFLFYVYLHHASWQSSATLTEVFPCFFLRCKENASVKPAKKGHGPHSSNISVLILIFVLFYVVCFVLFCVLCVCVCVCNCVLCCCHRLSIRLQLTNISYRLCRNINDSFASPPSFNFVLPTRHALCILAAHQISSSLQ